MDVLIDFPGASRVDAHFGSFTVATDQPPDSSAPTPFDLFLCSIGTCAGIYVLRFCRERNLPTEGLQIVERVLRDPGSGSVIKIALEIRLSPGFPEKYRDAVVRAAGLCSVKRHLEHPPQFEITACPA